MVQMLAKRNYLLILNAIPLPILILQNTPRNIVPVPVHPWPHQVFSPLSPFFSLVLSFTLLWVGWLAGWLSPFVSFKVIWTLYYVVQVKKRMFLVALVLKFCELLGMLAWIVRHRLSWVLLIHLSISLYITELFVSFRKEFIQEWWWWWHNEGRG